MTVWRLILHHQDPGVALEWTRSNKRIAVAWGYIGDIKEHNYLSSKDIGAAIRCNYPELRNSGLGGPSLWNFYQEMQRGDLVIVAKGSSGKSPNRCCVVRIVGDYEYRTQDSKKLHDYDHQRKITFTDLDADKLWEEVGGAATGESIRRAVIRCGNSHK